MTDTTEYDLGFQDGSTGLAQYSTGKDYAKGYEDGRIDYLKWLDRRNNE
jgi:hypothetical protein